MFRRAGALRQRSRFTSAGRANGPASPSHCRLLRSSPPVPTQVFAVAQDDAGNRYDGGSFTIAYSHIRPRSYYRDAKSTIHSASLTLPHVARIGYIRGAADRVPEALQTIGLKVELLDGKALDRTDLSSFRAIIVGPRAYETDPDLPGNNDNLLAFARKGGLVLVQYQQYAFFLNDYAPYPLTVGSRAPGTTTVSTTRRGSPSVGGTALLGGHDRVTDETGRRDSGTAGVSRPASSQSHRPG